MLVSRREFDPRRDLAMNFDARGSASIVFGPFLRGGNSTNPVKGLNQVRIPGRGPSFLHLPERHVSGPKFIIVQ